LVEVTIALGILAVAIIPIMGLIMTGYGNYQTAMQHTVRAAIVQDVRTLSSQITATQQELPDAFYTMEGTTANGSGEVALYRVEHHIGQGSFSHAGGTQTLNQTLVNRFEIFHIPSGESIASGAVHITPR